MAPSDSPAFGVIFDGDDTLWSTEHLYDNARSASRLIVDKSGLDGARWDERERLIDMENVAKFGYSLERFPTSCVQAYEELCLNVGRSVDTLTVNLIWQAARSVFDQDPPLVTGALETLALLRNRRGRLALLTKGDPALQARRIQRSGLRQLFDVVRVVHEKTPRVIREMVYALGVDVGSAWMVGNSIRSDVLPALRAGLNAVWIPAHVWEYERAEDHRASSDAFTVSSLAEVPALITT